MTLKNEQWVYNDFRNKRTLHFPSFSSVFERSMDRRIISLSDDPSMTSPTRSIQGHVTMVIVLFQHVIKRSTLRSVFVYYWLWRQQRVSFIISIQDYRTVYPFLYVVCRTWSYRPPTHHFNLYRPSVFRLLTGSAWPPISLYIYNSDSMRTKATNKW